jgi:hypothetical protein
MSQSSKNSDSVSSRSLDREVSEDENQLRTEDSFVNENKRHEMRLGYQWKSTVIDLDRDNTETKLEANRELKPRLISFGCTEIKISIMPNGQRLFALWKNEQDFVRFAREEVLFREKKLVWDGSLCYEDEVAKYRVRIFGIPSEWNADNVKKALCQMVPEHESQMIWDQYGVLFKESHPPVAMVHFKQPIHAMSLIAERWFVSDDVLLCFSNPTWTMPSLNTCTEMFYYDCTTLALDSIADFLKSFSSRITAFRVIKHRGSKNVLLEVLVPTPEDKRGLLRTHKVDDQVLTAATEDQKYFYSVNPYEFDTIMPAVDFAMYESHEDTSTYRKKYVRQQVQQQPQQHRSTWQHQRDDARHSSKVSNSDLLSYMKNMHADITGYIRDLEDEVRNLQRTVERIERDVRFVERRVSDNSRNQRNRY